MEVVSLLIKIVLCLCSLFLIIVVLLQSEEAPKTIGDGGISKKARGLNVLLSKLTKVAAISFMVLAIALVLLQRFF
jgi:preprotein translocase subunit SecG